MRRTPAQDQASLNVPRVAVGALGLLRDYLARKTVRTAADEAVYYRERFASIGFDPRDVRRVSDIAKLGFFTSQEDLAADCTAFQAVPDDRVYRFGESSGTTGASKRIAVTRSDWRWLVRTARWGLRSSGVGRGDSCVMLFASPRPEWFLADILVEALGRCGARVSVAESLDPEAVVEQIVSERATMLIGPPAYLLSLTRVTPRAELRRLGVRQIRLGAEPFAETSRDIIADAWGATVLDGYGLMEFGGVVAGEIAPRAGLELSPFVFAEVVDPAGSKTMADGDVGELVLTGLGGQGTTLIRYRTGDLVAVQPTEGGRHRVAARLSRIVGRVDDMVTVGLARNLHPVALEDLIAPVEDVSSFQLVVETLDGRDVLTIRLETNNRAEVTERVCARLSEHIPVLEMDAASGAIHPLRFELLEPGTLAAEPGHKLRRLVDRRDQRYPHLVE